MLSRYIHKQCPNGDKHRGFSVLLEPSNVPGSVKIRSTHCSIKDLFCKRQARDTLAFKSAWHIPVRNLPDTLQTMEDRCYSEWSNPFMTEHRDKQTHGNQWAWVWKYFL